MTHKAMKFRVKNPEHSKAIQERLFEMGYKWFGEHRAAVEKTKHPFLYADSNLDIFYGNTEELFDKEPNTETTLEEITEWTPKQGEMIEVSNNGEKWLSREFLIHDKRFSFPFICVNLDGTSSATWTYARPLNPIRTEIEALKARLNEIEAKL